jgi:hypothetical protein
MDKAKYCDSIHLMSFGSANTHIVRFISVLNLHSQKLRGILDIFVSLFSGIINKTHPVFDN